MKSQMILGYLSALTDPAMRRNAVRVALVVGSLLFAINHGLPLIQGKMTRARWISALLTYCVPYAVSVHGQYISHKQQDA